jgi:hypothetical protein
MAFVKHGGNVLDVCFITSRDSHGVLERLKLKEGNRLCMGWLDVQEVYLTGELINSFLNPEPHLVLLRGDVNDVSGIIGLKFALDFSNYYVIEKRVLEFWLLKKKHDLRFLGLVLLTRSAHMQQIVLQELSVQ